MDSENSRSSSALTMRATAAVSVIPVVAALVAVFAHPSVGVDETIPDVVPMPEHRELLVVPVAPPDDAAGRVGSVADVTSSVVPGPCDAAPVTAERLDREFDGGIDEMAGADYQRAFELWDGRVLWVFQDAFVDRGVGAPTLVHNAAVIQDGLCFDAVYGGSSAPSSWVGGDLTTPFERWFWPLDGYQSGDDTFTLMLAEVHERGDQYLDQATPVATWSVEIDLLTLTAGVLVPAPDASDALYGFDVTTDDDYVYLYAHCHRQFGFGPGGHDDCASDVTVARQPLGEPAARPTYWDGATWSDDPDDAINVAPTTAPDGASRHVNPMQIERDDDRWIAATLVGDWWGDAVHFDVAPRPEGPWTTTAIRPLTPASDEGEVASYFVSFVPSDDPGRTIAVSNNRWDGRLSEQYRPRFDTVTSSTWAARTAIDVGDGVWLPLGPTIG